MISLKGLFETRDLLKTEIALARMRNSDQLENALRFKLKLMR